MTVKSFIKLFFPLFLFFFFIDIEVSIGSFSGQEGERMGGAAYDSQGEHTTKTTQEIPLKISDAIFVALSFCFFCLIVTAKDWKISTRFWRHYSLLLLFITISAVTITMNGGMSYAQKVVCFLYLIKFFQASFIYVLTYLYFSCGGSLRPIFQALLMTTYFMLIFGLIGSLSTTFGVKLNLSWIIPERIQYYGVLSVLSLIWLVFLVKNIPTVKFLGLTKNQLLCLFIISFITIMLCGKRTIMFSYLFSILFLFLASFTFKDIKKTLIYSSLLVIVTLPFMGSIVDRTFNANQGASLNIAVGLAPRYQEIVADSDTLSQVELSGVDFSVTERIVKTAQSLIFFSESPVFGSGYWSSPFDHNYLPDSALLQVLVEGGLIGFILISSFIFAGWNIKAYDLRSSLELNLSLIYKVSAVFILIAGLAANTVYTSSLFGLLIFLACLLRLTNFKLLNEE